jgi:hypothetical protein
VRVTQSFGGECNLSRCRGVLVGDYTACIREFVDGLASYRSSCEKVGTDAGPSPVASPIAVSAACQRVQESCGEE